MPLDFRKVLVFVAKWEKVRCHGRDNTRRKCEDGGIELKK